MSPDDRQWITEVALKRGWIAPEPGLQISLEGRSTLGLLSRPHPIAGFAGLDLGDSQELAKALREMKAEQKHYQRARKNLLAALADYTDLIRATKHGTLFQVVEDPVNENHVADFVDNSKLIEQFAQLSRQIEATQWSIFDDGLTREYLEPAT